MYGGTKQEMQRLIDDANKVKEANGEMADLTIESFADVAEAIHIIQDEMDIAGATREEAMTTIEGSLNATKAAWDNLLTGIADDNADFDQLVDNFVESVGIATDNVLPRLEKSLEGISKLISELMPVIFGKIPSIIAKTLPNIAQSAVGIVQALIDGISENKETLFSTIAEVVETISTAFLEMLPEIIQLGLDLIVALAEGIAEAIPELIPVITDTVLEIVDVLTNPDNIGHLVEAALQIMLALGKGLIKALPKLVEKIPEIVKNVVKALTDNVPVIVEAGVELFVALVQNLPAIISGIVAAIPEIISAILEGLGSLGGELANLFSEAWEGIKGVFAPVGEWFGTKFQEAKESAVSAWDDASIAFSTAWENVKGAFATAGEWFGEKFQEAKESATNAWADAQTLFSTIWENIKTAFAPVSEWFTEKFDEAKEDAVAAWDNVKSDFDTVWENIKSAFDISEAFSWGSDMIENFKQGIRNKWASLTETLSATAAKVKSFLGFSEPEKGPLSNFHTFAPDMMQLFARGITDNIPMLGRTTRDAAQAVANGWNRDYNIPTASVSYNSSAVGVASAGMINSGFYQADASTYPLTFNLVLPDGEKLASYMLNPLINYSAAKGTPILQPI